MAITDNAIVAERRPIDGSKWFISMSSSDLSGTEILKAAVAGKSHYVTRLNIYSASAITVTVGGGENSGSLVNTYIGPIPFSTAGPHYELAFNDKDAMKILTGIALTIDASGAGAVTVYAEGVTG